MTSIRKLIIAWLSANEDIAAAASGRISVLLEPQSGFPAIVVGDCSGGPTANGSSNVSRFEAWTVPIYCLGARRNGEDDVPDFGAAEDLASLVVSAMADLDAAHFQADDAVLVAGSVITATTSSFTEGQFARSLVTGHFQSWRAAA